MSPDLTKQNLSESTRQASLDELSAYLSYVLAYPEADTDIEMPEDTGLNGTVWVNTTMVDLEERLKTIRNSEALGGTESPIQMKRLSNVEITEPLFVHDIYQYVIEEQNFDKESPIKVFFLETDSSAVIIIPVQVWVDLLAVQVVPMSAKEPLIHPVLLKIQELWNEKTKDRGMKSNQDLLKIPGIKRGSDL